ncbi:hypothetical protein [Streptomyces hirsutus]|uniref:hypothetical protein n=1 Tax=Streptomyces hirsutus TaxID=35620 RepID=UPI003F4B0282
MGAAGRHGVAVARTHDGERTEWIFDKSTARLLGERTVLLEDNAWGKAGTVVTSVALIGSGIAAPRGVGEGVGVRAQGRGVLSPISPGHPAV